MLIIEFMEEESCSVIAELKVKLMKGKDWRVSEVRMLTMID